MEPLKHCAFRSRQTRIGSTSGPSTMNRSPNEIAALTAAIRLSRTIGQDFPDKTIQAQSDAGGGFLRALHIGQPAKPKVCIPHFESPFNQVLSFRWLRLDVVAKLMDMCVRCGLVCSQR